MNIDTDAVLSSRDQPEFENEWLRIFNNVKDLPLSDDQASIIDRMRETAYKAAFEATQDPDLSGYVSDDFEVIGKAVAGGLDDEFSNGLLKSYVEGKLPGGIIMRVRGSRNSIISALREKL